MVRPHFAVAEDRGLLTEMKASPESESLLAAAMQRVYEHPERPELPASIIDSFDRANAYRLYVDLVRSLAAGGT